MGRQLRVVTAGTEAELSRPSQQSNGTPVLSASPPTHSSPPALNNSSRWRHGMQFPPAIHIASTSRLAA